jgi:hypothetical protein
MGLFSLQAAVAKMCLSTSRPLSGLACVRSTKDKPSSTRLRAIAADSPRPILGSSSGISALSVADAVGRAVSDGCDPPLTTLLASIAEFERELIRERTGEGRKRSMAAGVKFGRKRKLSDYQRAEAIKRRAAGETLASIAKSYRVHVTMISRL